MRWQKTGAQTILNLRVLQLSGVWQAAYARILSRFDEAHIRAQPACGNHHGGKAA